MMYNLLKEIQITYDSFLLVICFPFPLNILMFTKTSRLTYGYSNCEPMVMELKRVRVE